jgi:quinol monooxygenase YgiN
MPAEIVIVADLWAADGKVDEVVARLTRVVEYAHANEPGTLRFALHRDVEDPNHLTMIEAFTGEDALATHRASDEYKDLMDHLLGPDLLTRRERLVLEPLGIGEPDQGHIA